MSSKIIAEFIIACWYTSVVLSTAALLYAVQTALVKHKCV